jgi:4'-phosphopantetheinyl transferase
MVVAWFEQVAASLPVGNDWLAACEQERLAGMRFPKRRADWRLGRWTAKHAVAAYLKLDCSPSALAALEIRPAASGAPQVFIEDQPAAVSISISHRGDVAACAIAPSGTMLGCDLELIEPRSDAFMGDYLTLEEQHRVTQTPAADRSRVANLLWSAKECALKALGMGLRLDPRSAVVSFADGLSGSNQNSASPMAVTRQSQAPTWHPLRVVCAARQDFEGWWQQTDCLLRTMVAFPPPEPPFVLTRN